MENQVGTLNGPAIKLINLTKFYGSIKGIEQVNLEVPKGSIFGYLGPNGAGKSTTIRILSGLLNPSSGEGEIFGLPIGSIETKRLIGYLPSDFELYKHYTVKEYLDFIEQLRGSAPRRTELVSRLRMDESRKTQELSRGNKQKVAIIQALMHEPALLIADEPTTGLDPLFQEEFNHILKEFAARGNTVFLSSHFLTDVQAICEFVSVIKEGNIVSTGSVDELLSNLPRKAILKLKPNTSHEGILSDLDIKKSEILGDKLVVYFDENVRSFTNKLVDIDEIDDFILPEASLEEYFLPIYQK